MFNYNWELCKFEKLTDFFSGLTYSPDNVQKDGTFVLRSSNVKDNAIVSADNVYVRNEVANSEHVQVGDVIVVVRNGSRSLIGKHAPINREMPNTVIGAFMTGLRSPSPKFLKALLDTQQFNVEIHKNLGATINQITTGEFKRMHFTVPIDEDEKEKIGSLFRQLDDIIALHQRKLDQLKELKKAYLQVMFPVKDERVPKLRLADFEGEWEQCKFFDMWEKSSDRNKELKYSSKDVLSVAKMTKNPVERNSSDEYMKTYNILHYGDIAFEGNKSKDYSFGRFVLNNLQDGIVSHVFIVFKPKVKMDIDFMKVYINNEYFMKHHLVKATTKTLMMTTLNVQDMNKQKLRIPSLNEQERIGKFFKELDHAITLHQNKLTQLNSLKKSYLQNMFI
ncbi:hypothetical protein RMBD10P1_23670 [Enterococcus faecalis]